MLDLVPTIINIL